MFCSNCGNKIDENAKFCINCGAAQNIPAAPSVQNNPQPVEVEQPAPVQETTPAQETAPVQQSVPVQEAVPVQQSVPVQETVPVQQPVQPVVAKSQPVATQKQTKNKKLIPIIAIAAVAVIAVVIGIFAFGSATPAYSEGLEFRSNGDGTCAWVGIGTCIDTEIYVPDKNGEETVTSVAGDTIDYYAENVTKIVLPKTIKTIEDSAFARARQIKKIELNEGLESIGENAFYGCESLENVKFPSTLKSIGEWAFSGCVQFTEVSLPEGFNELGKFSFNECANIKKISLPSTLNKIHLISEKGGNCGFEFDTTSIEEVNFAGEWKHTTLDLGIDEDAAQTEFYYYGELSQDISEEEYPGSFYNITEENKETVICAIFNKKTLKYNGKQITFSKEKPKGKYKVQGYYGFTVQEFTDDGKIKISYEGWSEATSQEDAVIGSYTFDESRNVYTFKATGTVKDSPVTIEKTFVNFNDFILSLDYSNTDGQEYQKLFKWDPYSAIIKDFIEEDVEIEDDKLEDLVEMKEDLLADLIAAFRAEGITVSVNEETGELALDSSVLFGGDSAVLTENGKEFITRFLKVYTSVIYSEKYDGFISKTMVEGHTAPVKGSTYDSGLPLSEERANNVKNYCVSSENGVDTGKLASSLEAIGYSNSKPIYDTSGKVNMAASRRVSFRFIINLDQ